MNKKELRRTCLIVVLGLAVIMAGCIQYDTPTGDILEGGIRKKEDDSQSSVEIPPKLVKRINRTTRDFLPDNRTELNNETVKIATDVCTNTKKINLDVLEEQSDIPKNAVRRFRYGAEIVENNYNIKVDLKQLEGVLQDTSKATKYLPLLGSYNRLVDDSCTVKDNPTNETLDDFYISAVSLGVDLIVVEFGLFYKPAFRATGVINNKASLATLRRVCGTGCQKLVMSEIYATINGGMWGLKTYLIEESRKRDLEFKVTDKNVQHLKEKLPNITSSALGEGKDYVEKAKDWWDSYQDGE